MEHSNFSPNSEIAPINSVELVESVRGGDVVCYQIGVGGQIMGGLDLLYKPDESHVEIDMVYLEKHWRGRGYETALYGKIPGSKLPDGSTVLESGLKFVSPSALDDDTERVWVSLVKDGLARVREDGRYEFVPKPQDLSHE